MNSMHAVRLVLLIALTERSLYNIGLVLVVISLVVTSILAYRVWGEMHEDIEPATNDELLAPFEGARAAGEIDDEEYARLRQQIQKAQPPSPVTRPGKRRGP
ncbi:MAG TPA: hypothetical protein VJY33_17145 [Isosphaeraceae bacterium]|nr:hypothetical protein [Isosphaeraceae bacterium]